MSSGASFSLNQKSSKRTKRKEKAQAQAFNPYDLTAFADKEWSKSFDEGYNNGYFRDEIRYYHVPWYIVRFEHKWLRQHQHNTILDILLAAHVELDLKNKLLTCLGKEAGTPSLPLVQLGESILQPLKLIEAIHRLLNSSRLVHKTMLPQRQRMPKLSADK